MMKFNRDFKNFKSRRKFDEYNEYNEIIPVFYCTEGYTRKSLNFAKRNKIKCFTEDFYSLEIYPFVKCYEDNGEKVYCLPFDHEFDRVNLKFFYGDCQKFNVYAAEKAGYRYIKNPKQEKNFWEDEQNYSHTFFHSGYWEYVELKSCKFIYNNSDEYCFEANFIGIMNNIPPKIVRNGTRKFRQKKDLISFPEFYDEQKNCWIKFNRSREILKNEGLGNYINHQHSFERKMFVIIFKQLFKFEYSDPEEDYIPNWNKVNLPFWHGDKNFPVGYYHAGYFEFIDLKSCKIIYTNSNEYTIVVSFFSAAQFRKGIIKKSSRTFHHKKFSFTLPQIYNDKNHNWETLPKLRPMKNGEEGFVDYIEKQQLYSWTMFKIVYKYFFGIEYK